MPCWGTEKWNQILLWFYHNNIVERDELHYLTIQPFLSFKCLQYFVILKVNYLYDLVRSE